MRSTWLWISYSLVSVVPSSKPIHYWFVYFGSIWGTHDPRHNRFLIIQNIRFSLFIISFPLSHDCYDHFQQIVIPSTREIMVNIWKVYIRNSWANYNWKINMNANYLRISDNSPSNDHPLKNNTANNCWKYHRFIWIRKWFAFRKLN